MCRTRPSREEVGKELLLGADFLEFWAILQNDKHGSNGH